MREQLAKALPGLTSAQAEAFVCYYEMLADWNTRVNLTAITDPEGVAKKHFADSLLPVGLIPQGALVIDVGTGAGFPGLPLKILRPDIRLTLLDSLQKRLAFLEAVCGKLQMDARLIHARAEDGGRMDGLRGHFDIVTARAVAGCAVLAELTVPFLKVGGRALLYKGPQAGEELAAAGNACKLLSCAGRVLCYEAEWGSRNVIELTKLDKTPRQYPRKAGTPEKSPL